MTASSAFLAARGIGKAFPGVRALDGVSLEVAPGEVLGLVGENGAGKSTLVKILAGVQEADRGEIAVDGAPVRFRSVQDAQAAGIALIHQELMLVGDLDVAANISLGNEPRRGMLLDREAELERARRRLADVGLDVSPRTPVADLPLGQRQLVEIAKALAVEARLLIMDEPTSSLSQGETRRLFEVVKALRAEGRSLLYISHRLGEVEELCDRVLVLRDGRPVGELAGDEIRHERMVPMMIGRDVSRLYPRKATRPGEPVLEVRGLRTPANPAQAVELDVRAGEIVGIAGLVGAGRTELLECLFGVTAPLGGSLFVSGREVAPGDTRAAIASGLVLVPEDRQRDGLLLEESVRDNLALTTLGSGRRHGLRDHAGERRRAAELVRRLAIAVSDPSLPVGTLSGGNQQKVVLGKWLEVRPRVLLLDEPTRGVDVGSKAELYGLLEELAEQGLAVLFASSELEEILGLADRVFVMREGRVAGSLTRAEASERAILDLATAEPASASA